MCCAFPALPCPPSTDLDAIRELKRREKQREKEAKKAERAAAAPKPESAKAAAPNEADLSPNVSYSSGTLLEQHRHAE